MLKGVDMFKGVRNLRVPTTLINKRSIHEVPRLGNQDEFTSKGIEGLYTPSGFKTAWLDYQKYLTMRLTMLTNGTENELRSPYQILLQTAKQTTEQHTFHFASQAHNNHFCFEQLADRSEAQKTRPSKFLMERLADKNLLNLESFKNHVISVANSMCGQGWVFLVELPDKSLEIIKCNNDGTPYYYGKNQSLDLNGRIDEQAFERLSDLKLKSFKRERDFSLPLLGINCWDTAIIEDYGTTGKTEYFSNFWECINWDVVNRRMFQI